MHHTSIANHAQQRFIQTQRQDTDCLSTFNLLTSDILLDEVERRLPEHRERLFPPTETLAMFVTQALSADRSCQHVVNQAAVQRLVTGLPACLQYAYRRLLPGAAAITAGDGIRSNPLSWSTN